MRKFLVLVKKEIRELLTLQMLVPLIAVMAVFVFIGKAIGKQQQNLGNVTVAVLDLDKSAWSQRVEGLLMGQHITVDHVEAGDVQQALQAARSKNEKLLVVIPQRFGASLESGSPQQMPAYTVVQNFSMIGNRAASQLQTALAGVNEAVSDQLLAGKVGQENSTALKNPIRPQYVTVVGDRQATVSPAAISGFISSQTTFIPIILFLVIVFASQLIAVSIATEKENKTLETLLSAPVSRNTIVSAKLVGAGLVALITSVIYLLGMRSYMNGLTGGNLSSAADAATRAAASQLGLIMTTGDYVLLGLSLFFGILVALSIALLLGALVEDVKSAQGMIAPLMVLILVPYFLVMFLDTSTLSPAARWLVYAIPFSHPFMAAPNLMLRQYRAVWLGIGYMAVWFLVFVVIAGRIFSSEKILTMRLTFKRK